ncbi:MAG: DUF5684 domain-containing protein [Candidatus Omnitrophota bacterium]|nr:hypothetical protein [Candidatus Omnitrophota bacterium]
MKKNRQIFFVGYIAFLIAICGVTFKILAQDDQIVASVIPQIHVTGVIYDGQEPVAIINGEIVREGDSISGVKVLKVNESEVKLQYQDDIFIRKLGAKSVTVDTPFVKISRKKSGIVSFLEFISSRSGVKINNSREIKKIGAVIRKNIAKMIWIAWLIPIFTYVYSALTLQIIAKKTNTENSWLAWIPIASLYLVCEIADRPAWWMLLLFLPYVNIIIFIILWKDIAKARGKSGWLGLCVIIPIISFVVMGYLAFSGDKVKKLEDVTKIPQRPSMELPPESSTIELPPENPPPGL